MATPKGAPTERRRRDQDKTHGPAPPTTHARRRHGAPSAVAPPPPRPPARPAGACCATLRHGAGRDATTTATTSSPRRRRSPPGGADRERQGADETQMKGETPSAVGPLPPRPPARPARRLLRYATPRRGAGRGTRRRQRRHRARDAGGRRRGGQSERGKTKLRRGGEPRRETPQPDTPAACPSLDPDRRREPKGVGACIGRRKTRGRHAAELPARRRPASAAERRGMAQECRRRAARWVSRPSPTLKPDHTSPADTCQRLRRIIHDTLTDQCTSLCVPSLIRFDKSWGICPVFRDAHQGVTLWKTRPPAGEALMRAYDTHPTRAAPHTRG